MGFLLLVWAGFELKHFIADYLLQTRAMIRGKADLAVPGGYLHAGIHVLSSMIVLLLAAAPPGLTAALLAAEFVVHYGLDFAKARLSDSIDAATRPKLFWALHGLDQTLHRFTYIAMAWALVAAV